MLQNADRQAKRQRIAEMTEFLKCQIGVIGQYDDRLVRRLVERVTVNEGRVVGFKSEVKVEVEI